MIDAVHHPDGGELVPVDDLLTDVYHVAQANAADLDTIESLLDSQDKAITHLLARVDTQERRLAALETLPPLVAELSTKVDNANADLAALAARVKKLEDPSALGVDISGHQNTATTQAAVADPANDFIIVKASEGMGGSNDSYAAQRTAAGSKFLGAYHFAWTGQDPLKEAENFITRAALRPGDMAFLDAEKYNDTDPIDWAKSVNFCLTWLDTVKARTGVTPLVYVNWNWIKGLRTAATVAQWERLVAYPLWLAQWTNVPGKFDTVSPKAGSAKGWPVLLHQYGVIDGLDRNYTPDLKALKEA